MLHLGKKIYRHTDQTEMLCSHLGNAYFILVDMGYMFFARSLFLEFVFSYSYEKREKAKLWSKGGNKTFSRIFLSQHHTLDGASYFR
jgi:hypothetical protein